jgi:hypothetical protein
MRIDFYSNCSSLTAGCRICRDAHLFNPVEDSIYSDGTSCYTTSNGIITDIGPCVIPCDLAITRVTSTDPTTLGGTDGTITVTFTGTHPPFFYSIYQVALDADAIPLIIGGTATSPQLITGLSSNITYKIDITDSNNCTASATATLGQTATRFDADWIMVSYQFTDGRDLDTRSRIAIPNIGQDTQPEYLGWSCLSAFAPSVPGTTNPNNDVNTHTIMHGGDNRGTGFESILINVKKFKIDNPSATTFTVDLRSFWFGQQGFQPVNAGVTLWKGGTPVLNSCLNSGSPYCWTNTTAAFSQTIASVPTVITMVTTSGTTSGQRVATMKYDLTTYIAVLNNNDTTTPSV